MTLTRSRSVEPDNALSIYFEEIADSEPLSSQREAELAERIQAGDEAARQELAQANLRFVVSVARQFQHRGLTLAELVSAGNLGLMIAVDRFDGQRGFKFISYAVWWIKQAIRQALAEDGRMVRLPTSQLAILRKMERALKELRRSSDDGVVDLEIVADELGLTVEEVRDTISNSQHICSLDEPLDKNRPKMTFLGIMADKLQPEPSEAVLRQESRAALDQLVDALDPREREIIRVYYNLNNEVSVSLEQIGAKLGVTRERVRQLKEKALRQLRRPPFIKHVLKLSELDVELDMP